MLVESFLSGKFSKAYNIEIKSALKIGSREGLYPTFCKVSVGGATVLHSHFESEVLFILSGSGCVSLDGTESVVKNGDLIKIPPFTSHQLKNTTGDDLQFLSVYSEDFTVNQIPEGAVVTAAPPTPNGPLHLGHISGPYLAADILARYLKIRGTAVRSHSGTDDHQNYVPERAAQLNISFEHFLPQMRQRIETGLEKMGIQFSEFIQPSKDRPYQARIQAFVQRALEKGVIQKKAMMVPHCEQCDLDLIDALIGGNCPNCKEFSRGGCEVCGFVVPHQGLLSPHCSRCASTASFRAGEVYVFQLSEYLPLIAGDLSALPVSNKIRALIQQVQGEKHLEVIVGHSRNASLNNTAPTGITFPGDVNQVIHVWLEMAAHYEQFAQGSETWFHCFGFDNAFYYLLFIPALLKAMDSVSKFPEKVIINEFLLLEGSKFSTSRNHAIWADEATFERNSLRLYLCENRPQVEQTNFDVEEYQAFAQKFESQMQVLSILSQQETSSRLDSFGLREAEKRSDLIFANRLTRDFEGAYLDADFRRAARLIQNLIDTIEHRKASHLVKVLVQLAEPMMPGLWRSLGEQKDFGSAAGKELNRGESSLWITDWSEHL